RSVGSGGGRGKKKVVPAEPGRRTKAKRAMQPIATSTLKVGRLLMDGAQELKPTPLFHKRRRLWEVGKPEEKAEDEPLADHPDWTHITPTHFTAHRILPQPLPMNYDLLGNERLLERKKKDDEMKQQRWKQVDWMERKREENQDLPKYIRPQLLLQYKKALEEAELLEKSNDQELAAMSLISLNEKSAQEEEEARRRHQAQYSAARAVYEGRYGKEHTKAMKKIHGRKEEIQSWMMEDLEERIRSIETEINNLDVCGVGGPQSAKKQLRSGRPSVATVPIDYVPEPEPEVPKKRAKPNSMQPLSFLLSETGIYRDLRRLGKLDLLHGRAISTFKATIDNQKLIYESKSYPRGQPLFIQTEAYPWFPVIILSMNEGWVQFRSSIPGDTRCVTATIEDLEAGRVLVSKLPR
ncbi:hypothetical protein PENTCL1PPCAC_29169, partial [Pristionchus entomophagus]